MQNVVKLGSSQKDAAIAELLNAIASIRSGEMIGLTLIKTSSSLSVCSTIVLEPFREEMIRSA